MNMFQQIQSLNVSSHVSYYILKLGPTFPMIIRVGLRGKWCKCETKQIQTTEARDHYIDYRATQKLSVIISDLHCQLDFCLTVHHQLGKVIQMNQLHATMIYWSIRSAQHVSGNIFPIIRSVRLRYLQHMVPCKDGYTESYVVSYVICRNDC